MSKTTVTRLFIGGVVAIVAGVVLGLAAVGAAIASGVIVMDGTEFLGFEGGALGWMVIGIVIGGVAIIGGSITCLVSWIGALLNTAQLEDKTWFVLLLVLGLVSFGFVAMIAYVVAGPDGTREAQSRQEFAAPSRI